MNHWASPLVLTDARRVPNAPARQCRRTKESTLPIISRARPGQSTANTQDQPPGSPDRPHGKKVRPHGKKVRRALGALLTLLAAVLVYLALVVPDNVAHAKEGTNVAAGFLRLPIEALLGGALLIAVPRRGRRLTGVLLGSGLGVLTVLKILNAGFLTVLGRRFNVVLDPPLFRDGFNALTETNGRATAIGAAVGAVLLSVAVLALVTLSVVRLSGVTRRHAGPARRALLVLSVAWLALALTGVTLYPNNPVAADSSIAQAKSTAKSIPAAMRDQREFEKATRNDPFRDVPAGRLVAGLDGHDVVIGVVESYGRSSLTDPRMKAIVDPMLAGGTRTLSARGYHAKSGWLTSSTFGGGSWLAHGSFQSGLWIDNQQRYRQLTASNRLTITRAFHDAGWQTYGMEPGNTVAWPEAEFYGYDSVYDSRDMGYAGPRFGWSRMPDQYTLDQFQKNVYGRPHKPLMAEITMTSSHEPWTPIPQTVGWDQIGNGKIYDSQLVGATDRHELWKSSANTRVQYAKSIAYSVQTLISWVEKYGDDNLVLVFFGDHQPFSIVSGNNGGHDVPVTIVAHDQAVLDRIAGWNWTDGLEPAAGAPVWKMSDFRNRFFDAYRGEPAPSAKAR
jgi:hypothetical protein